MIASLRARVSKYTSCTSVWISENGRWGTPPREGGTGWHFPPPSGKLSEHHHKLEFDEEAIQKRRGSEGRRQLEELAQITGSRQKKLTLKDDNDVT